MKCDERHHLWGPRPRAVERSNGQKLAQGFGRSAKSNVLRTFPVSGAEHFDGMAILLGSLRRGQQKIEGSWESRAATSAFQPGITGTTGVASGRFPARECEKGLPTGFRRSQDRWALRTRRQGSLPADVFWTSQDDRRERRIRLRKQGDTEPSAAARCRSSDTSQEVQIPEREPVRTDEPQIWPDGLCRLRERSAWADGGLNPAEML